MSDLYRSTPKQDVPTRDQIAHRAYEIYQNRGRVDGRDVEDWLAAERELRSQNSPNASISSSSADKSRNSSLPTSRQRQSKTRTAISPSSFENTNPVDHQNSSREF
jgi:hypothetical protein